MNKMPSRDGGFPVATSDTHFETMAADPAIKEFPQGSTYDSTMKAQGFDPAQVQAENIKSSGGAMHEGADVLVKADDKFGNWINSRWRPLFAVMYLIACACDFVLFPIFWTTVQFWETQAVNDAFRQWQPLTIQGGGLFHIACGAVLGITAYGRTQEKLNDKA